MSIELVAKAKKIKLGGDSTAKLLLICLADYANDAGMAWPSVATMTEEVEKKERTIQNSLRKLEHLGLIRVGDQRCTGHLPKGQRPTVYEILPGKRGKGKHESSARAHHVARVQPTAPVETTEDTGAIHDTPTGAAHCTPTGATHDTPPVQHIAPEGCSTATKRGAAHCTQTVIEPPKEPSRESTRATKTNATKTKNREHTNPTADLDAWTPNSEHQALADSCGLDLDAESEKFTDRLRERGTTPADLDAAFRNWLRRGRELGLGGEPRRTHRHTWKCDHVQRILAQADTTPDENPDLAMALAARLRDGADPDALADELADERRGDYWEAA